MHASNGFHPLWQLVECLLFLFHLPDLWSIHLVLFTGAALLAGAFVLLGRLMTRQGRLSPLFALMPLGAFGALVAPYYRHLLGAGGWNLPIFGAIWNDIDGMETCLTVFCFALAAYFFAGEPEKRPLRFGASLAALTFARLDHGLFAGMLFLAFALRLPKDPATVARAALAFGLPVVAYLLVNVLVFGSPLPLSGVLKSTFPHPLPTNWTRFTGTLKAPLAASVWRMYRLLQCVIPVLLAPLTLLLNRRDRVDQLLRATAVAVVLLGNYDFWFVDLTAHGHWYFPVSLLFVSLLALRAIDLSGIAAWLLAAASAAACLYCFFVVNDRGNYNTFYGDFFFDEAPKLKQFYGDKQPRIIEMDDGIIAFSTHYPCMSGSGLNLDRQALDAFRKHNFYSLAYQRGYDHLATWAYLNNSPLSQSSSSQAVWSTYSPLMSPGDLYNFKVEYQSGRFTVSVGTRK